MSAPTTASRGCPSRQAIAGPLWNVTEQVLIVTGSTSADQGGPEDGSLPAPPPGEDHQELAWIPVSQLGELTLLPQHLAEDIPVALSTGQVVFHSERRIPVDEVDS